MSTIDFGGSTIVCKEIRIGANEPGKPGTLLTTASLENVEDPNKDSGRDGNLPKRDPNAPGIDNTLPAKEDVPQAKKEDGFHSLNPFRRN